MLLNIIRSEIAVIADDNLRYMVLLLLNFLLIQNKGSNPGPLALHVKSWTT